jgi:hypothetical protein
MRWNRTLLALPLLVVLPLSAPAGFFWKKAAKPDPATRVPELIATVKTDGDESKRAAAAEELRQYDPAVYHDIVPILIDVLLHDAKPSVRAEAASSLGKLRPISQEVGWALEQAVAKDTSMRVRLSARSALLMYRISGYRSAKVEEQPAGQSKEPPLADKAPTPPAITTTPALRPPQKPAAGNRLVPMPYQSPEPPLAPAPVPVSPPPAANPPLVPAAPPVLQKPPVAPPAEEGPSLIPPP